jgi:hypothetical protein
MEGNMNNESEREGKRLLICPNCGQENEPDSQFCSYCGQVLSRPEEEGYSRCPNCGELEEAGSPFCSHCGAPLDGSEEEWESPIDEADGDRRLRPVIISVAAALVLCLLAAFILPKMGLSLPFLPSAEHESRTREPIRRRSLPERRRHNLEDGDEEAIGSDSEPEYTESVDEESTSVSVPEIQEVTDASLISGQPDTSSWSMLDVTYANASSTIVQQNVDNSAMRMFDGRDDTNWEEGVNGYGVGEHVQFGFGQNRQVKFLGFKLGNWKTDEYYAGNAKPKTMTIGLGNYAEQITFTGNKETEWVEFNHPVETDSVTLTIDDVFPGVKWDDTVITEIYVYGE